MIKLISVANLTQIVDINRRRRPLSRKFNVSFHILCRLLFSEKTVNCVVKGRLLACGLRLFRLRFTVFCNALCVKALRGGWFPWGVFAPCNYESGHFPCGGESFDISQKYHVFGHKSDVLFCCVRKQPYLCNVKTRQIGIRFNRY